MAAQPPHRSAHPGHEKDARWAAVDTYAIKHLHPSTKPNHSALARATQLSEEHGLPSIEVSPLQGAFLAAQVQLLGAKHVLEVGTLGGYSTTWLASSDPEVKVTTVEISEKHATVAKQVFEEAGLSDRVEVRLGAGAEVLPTIRKEVEEGTRPKFDFVFIDADKPNNLTYLNEALPMCRARACVIVDNVVRQGSLADEHKAATDRNVQGARAVVEAAGQDERLLSTTLLQTVGEKNYDGFLLCVVK